MGGQILSIMPKKKRFREKAEGTFVWTETKTVFWEGFEGIYEQMIVYILLSFWTAGPWRGRKARTESVKSGFVLHIAHPHFPFRSEWGASLFACSENVRRPLKTLVHFHSAATVQTLFCWLNLLFSEFQNHIFILLYTPGFVEPFFFLLFAAASVGSECNGSWMRWRNKNIFAWKCCSKLTTAPLLTPLFLIFDLIIVSPKYLAIVFSETL